MSTNYAFRLQNARDSAINDIGTRLDDMGKKLCPENTFFSTTKYMTNMTKKNFHPLQTCIPNADVGRLADYAGCHDALQNNIVNKSICMDVRKGVRWPKQ